MNTQPALSNTEDEVQRLFGAVSDALSDQMVERLSASAGNVLEVVDRLNDEDTRDAVLTLLDQLTALHRSGGLVAAFEWIYMINAIRNALTDPMVERLTTFLEQTVNNLSTEGLSDLAVDATSALEAARTETENAQPSGGIMATLKLLGQPETQRSLQFLLAFAGKLQKPDDE